MTQSPEQQYPPQFVEALHSLLGRQSSGLPTSQASTEEPTGKHAATSEPDMVNHPPHYRCPNPLYDLQVLTVIRAWNLDKDYCRANAVKYILRAPFKGKARQDIGKAIFYLTLWLELDEESSQLDTHS